MNILTSKKILVIEDDTSMLNVLTDKLSEQGFRVIRARDGQKGLALALEKNPDLVLLDLRLPKLSGKELLEIMRKNKRGKNIPVIILTNDASPESIKDTLRKAAPAYFIKSETSLTTIVEAVQYHLK
jgi:DNA-binding response OmpR family regulator